MSPSGVAWKAEVARCARAAMKGHAPLEGELTVTMRFYFPSRRNDCDSSLKPTLDALQGTVMLNDRQVVRIIVEKELDRSRPRAEVEVRAMEEGA